eukprot:CAMPEP_0171462190 /NCGR_PEP_ID=MMETSP0945-20130129/6328_1 /TAXON_ID=109269 /ORGANISM="Vaucheria litorea, Strain CCMP2940" /LENGTH=130 /DNA_ID=CAMNT_0011988669 /DNA_START=39 /DNA_END=431 /DNA_ORIENTATION=-
MPPKQILKGNKGSKSKTPKTKVVRFQIRCQKPVDDGIMDCASFEKFLHDHIKVNGKTGQLGDTVKIVRDKAVITIIAKAPFSKRSLKYLTKKFLKKHQLRDWLHVIADTRTSYELRYFEIQGDDDDEEED